MNVATFSLVKKPHDGLAVDGGEPYQLDGIESPLALSTFDTNACRAPKRHRPSSPDPVDILGLTRDYAETL